MPNIDRDFMWLSNLDTKRRNNYLEPELDDKTHFIHAVEEDIISNAIYLDFALRYIPIDTIGMSSSCRTIMEALILIEASDSGMIPGENYKRFRDEYVFIEYSNGKRLFELLPDYAGEGSFKKLSEEYDSLSKKYCDELGLKQSEFARFAKDPMFVFFKKGDHSLEDFNYLVKKFRPDWIDNYHFLGMEIHPRFLRDEKLEKKERKQVKELSISMLTKAVGYLKEKYKKEMEEGEAKSLTETVNDPLYYGPWFIPINKEIEVFQAFLAHAVMLPTVSDSYTLYTMEKLTYLYYGMESMAILGFSEHAAMKFKSAIELISYYYLIEKAKDGLDAFNALKEAFRVSSEIQYRQLLNENNQDFETLFDRLKAVYESYYQKRYHATFDEFKDNICHNGKYFFSENKSFSYRKLVQTFLEDYLGGNELDRRNILCVYDTSIDMEHAGGYLMESSIGPWEQNCQIVMKFFQDFFLIWMSDVISTKRDAEESTEELEKCMKAYQAMTNLFEELRAAAIETHR